MERREFFKVASAAGVASLIPANLLDNPIGKAIEAEVMCDGTRIYFVFLDKLRWKQRLHVGDIKVEPHKSDKTSVVVHLKMHEDAAEKILKSVGLVYPELPLQV